VRELRGEKENGRANGNLPCRRQSRKRGGQENEFWRKGGKGTWGGGKGKKISGERGKGSGFGLIRTSPINCGRRSGVHGLGGERKGFDSKPRKHVDQKSKRKSHFGKTGWWGRRRAYLRHRKRDRRGAFLEGLLGRESGRRKRPREGAKKRKRGKKKGVSQGHLGGT